MYLAMNRFQIVLGKEEAFEEMWASRESFLDGVPGFRSFHLLRSESGDDFTLYSTHTVWDDRASFVAWTESEAFRKAHQGARGSRELYLGPPKFEGFESVQEIVATAS
ncbi:MAG: antibiotic biosynthesis monooxygenase [Myxococcota bacterium]